MTSIEEQALLALAGAVFATVVMTVATAMGASGAQGFLIVVLSAGMWLVGVVYGAGRGRR